MGERLKSERTEYGISRNQCADLVAVTLKTQGVYERGEGPISTAYLKTLDEKTNADIYYIITGRRKHAPPVVAKDEAIKKQDRLFLLDLYIFTTAALNDVGADLSCSLIKGIVINTYDDHLDLDLDPETKKELCQDFITQIAQIYRKGKINIDKAAAKNTPSEAHQSPKPLIPPLSND